KLYDVVVNGAQADRFGVAHRTAAPIRKAVAVHPNDINVIGPNCDAFRQDVRGLVDERINAPFANLVVIDGAWFDAGLPRDATNELDDGRIRVRGAIAVFVAIETGAGFLPEAAELAQ